MSNFELEDNVVDVSFWIWLFTNHKDFLSRNNFRARSTQVLQNEILHI